MHRAWRAIVGWLLDGGLWTLVAGTTLSSLAMWFLPLSAFPLVQRTMGAVVGGLTIGVMGFGGYCSRMHRGLWTHERDEGIAP